MQIIEFDPKNFIIGILLFLSGCFSSEKVLHVHETSLSFSSATADLKFPLLTIEPGEKNMLSFGMALAEDTISRAYATKTNEQAMNRTIKYLTGNLAIPKELSISIKKTSGMDDATFERVIKVLKENKYEKYSLQDD